MFDGDYWGDTDLQRARWLHTRRYIYFLVGSSVPEFRLNDKGDFSNLFYL